MGFVGPAQSRIEASTEATQASQDLCSAVWIEQGRLSGYRTTRYDQVAPKVPRLPPSGIASVVSKAHEYGKCDANERERNGTEASKDSWMLR